jgi:hypothetical protein
MKNMNSLDLLAELNARDEAQEIQKQEEALREEYPFTITKRGREFRCKIVAPELIPDQDGKLYAMGYAFGDHDGSGLSTHKAIRIYLED